MYSVELQARKALYEQIVDQVEKYVLIGLLKADEQMPSIRAMSLELTLNPNTVQRAYTELERKGIIKTLVGKGCFISSNAMEIIKKDKRNSLFDLQEQLKGLAIAGVEKREILALVDEIYATLKEGKQ